jgi:hypothetical protein
VSRTKEEDCSGPGLQDFSLFDIPKHGEIYQIAIKIPNGNKIHQIAVIYSKWAENISTFFSFQGLPKFTQIWIFGLKTNHLATLSWTKIIFLTSRSKQADPFKCA